jgi:uncharacterized protein YkwD
VKRCLLSLLALASALLLILPAASGATGPRHRHGTIRVRHLKINHPARHAHKRHRKHKRHHRKHSTARKLARGNRRRPATASDSCVDASLTPKPDNLERVRAATLCLVNGERARFGTQALIEDPHLSSAASGHSRDMVDQHYFEHTSPAGQTLLARIRASGFIPNDRVGYALGENIAWGTLWLGTPRAIVRAWMDSPGHRANILNGGYRYSGIGIDPEIVGGQAGGMYTQDFGTIDG